MYESFYGLTRRPCFLDPDPNCCAGIRTTQEAYDRLYDCFEHGKGIGVLTSPAGMGKTLLCQKLAQDLEGRFVIVFLPTANFSNSRSLLQAVLYELHRPYAGMDDQELRLELMSAARDIDLDQKSVLLMLDEAHLLSENLLEELRSCTNLIEGGRSLIHVLLSGQLGLEETLTSSALVALNQKIGCHETLNTLSRQESVDLIEFRLRWAGVELAEVFTEASIDFIVRVSDGNPRCLNQLCDHSLFLAYAEGEKPIDVARVRMALNDLKKLPLHWNDTLWESDQSDAVLESSEDSTDLVPADDVEIAEEVALSTVDEDSATIEVGAVDDGPDEIEEEQAHKQEEFSGEAVEQTIEIGGAEIEDAVLQDVPEEQASDETADLLDEEPVDDLYASIDANQVKMPVQDIVEGDSFSEGLDDLSNTTLEAEEQMPLDNPEAIEECSSIETPVQIVEDVYEPVWFEGSEPPSAEDELPVASETNSRPSPDQILDYVVPLLNAVADIPATPIVVSSASPVPIAPMVPQQPMVQQELVSAPGKAVEVAAEEQTAEFNEQPSQTEILAENQDKAEVVELEPESGEGEGQSMSPRLHTMDEDALQGNFAKKSIPLFSNGERLRLPIQFDVVQLDQEDRSPSARDEMVVLEPGSRGESNFVSRESNTLGVKKNYDQLFSELRRQRLA